MRTRSPLTLYLLTVILALPWLNLCVDKLDPISTLSVKRYKLPVFPFHDQEYNHMEIKQTSLTDLVVIYDKKNIHFTVLPETGEDIEFTPIETLPSKDTRGEHNLLNIDISNDIIENDGVRCISVKEINSGNNSYDRITIVC